MAFTLTYTNRKTYTLNDYRLNSNELIPNQRIFWSGYSGTYTVIFISTIVYSPTTPMEQRAPLQAFRKPLWEGLGLCTGYTEVYVSLL